MVAEPVKIRVASVSEACQYNRLRNGVHHFRFTVPSKAAVDTCMNQLASIIGDQFSGEPVLMLLDIRQSGLLPMTYVFNRLQNWIPDHQQSAPVYLAVVHSRNTMVSIIRPFLRMLGVETAYELAFFKDHEADSAVNWLVAKDNA